LVIIKPVFRVFITLSDFQVFLAKMMAQTIGYLRVSTVDQDLEKNKADILTLANHHNLGQVKFIEEKVSGKISWHKRKIAQVIEDLKKGDNLVVSEMSRLGRSMLECMEILSIAMERGVHVYSVKGNWRLDHSIQSKIVAMAFSMAAEIERDLISQRTKEALRAKKASGMTLGRPKGPGKSKLDPFRPEIEALLANGATQFFIAGRYGTTPANLRNWMSKHGISRPKQDKVRAA
jgi:DNA invertase Pin-like site-specific DNA recombinase